jgi:hypothetical protein
MRSDASSINSKQAGNKDEDSSDSVTSTDQSGVALSTGNVGWIDTKDLRVTYQESDLVKDKAGAYVPKAVESFEGEKYEEDVGPGQQNLERWSERSCCFLSINNGATILGAVHAGSNLKMLCKNGDLWQQSSQTKILAKNEYRYFEASPDCDLSIFVENTDKGFQQSLQWLSNIVCDPRIPADCSSFNENDLESLNRMRIITNRLPGTRGEIINGRFYEKIRNHSQAGQAGVIEGNFFGSDGAYTMFGLFKRDKQAECIYHGASGSPILIGEDGFVGILTASELYFDHPPASSTEEEKRAFKESKQSFVRSLQKAKLLNTNNPKEIDKFLHEHKIVHVTPLTKSVAASLLRQVRLEYDKFLQAQFKSKAYRSTNSEMVA